MKILKKLNSKISLQIGIIVFALLIIILGFNVVEINSTSEIKISDENPSWNTYTNKEYNFSIDFPADWEVYEDFENVSPTVNIYLPRKEIDPPFDHFANVNNVSIYPKGLSTEAVIGQSEETELEFDFESDKAIDYVLKDGTAWATYISFDDLDDPWKPWGFMWSKVMIEDLDYSCLRDGEEIDLDTCNPIGDDEFVRTGTVDQEIREIEEKIIRSFKIISE